MAKSKRSKSKQAARPTPKPQPEVESVIEAAPEPAAEPRAGRTPKMTRSRAAAERIEDEYAYITKDLRRVFILAAAMFGLLIVLNIILSQIG